jgi:transcriptional regulator with GAF, ATPase, and Fis domain
MKPVSEFFSTITPVTQGFPNANCSDLSERSGPWHSLGGTTEFEAFRSILMGLEPGVVEDELLLELRTQAARLLPCDKVCVAFREDGLLQIFEKPHGRESALFSVGSRPSIWNVTEAKLISEEVADQMRHASGVQAPFRINGASVGTVSFLANAPQTFRKSDTLIAQRIADSIGLILAKARMTEHNAEAKPCADADWKEPVVRALCKVPDIHQILPEISNLMHEVIPHDRLHISFHDKDRNISMRSASNAAGPTFDRFRLSSGDCPPDGSSVIINDLVGYHPSMQPDNFIPKVRDAGYRSFLITHVWSGQHGLGFVFWSKRGSAFHRRQVSSAQRLADLCAVAASREGLVPRVGVPGTQSEIRSTSSGAGLPMQQESPRADEAIRDSIGDSRQRSASWNAVLQSAKQVASTDTTVLLVGETGTGKEVIARLIYNESARKNGPFVAVNCAALPDSLLESELFGFERGAFTGAYHNKRGHIELAHRGVLFLDELSEMSLSAQAKLLRVLETREFQPLGSARSQKADLRVIGATNKDLWDEIRAGRFRADLYYRLCVFEISLPPLRSRKQDVLPLAYEFLADVRGREASKPVGISARAEDALLRYQWPGNVRELRNVIERASILCDGGVIDVEHLGFQTARAEDSTVNDIGTVERNMIERALRECGGNKARAARMLGLSRTQLYVRLRRYSENRNPYFVK